MVFEFGQAAGGYRFCRLHFENEGDFMNIASELEKQRTENRRKYLAILVNADHADAKTLSELDKLRSALGYSHDEVQTDLDAIRDLQRLDRALNDDESNRQSSEDADAYARAEAAVKEGMVEFRRLNAEWKQRQSALIQAAHNAKYRVEENGRSSRELHRKFADAKQARPDLVELLFNSEPTPRAAA